jgi:FkbM family methyltransferase
MTWFEAVISSCAALQGRFCAFDVGAHIGAVSVWIASRHILAKVYAFEPCTDFFNDLTRNTAEFPGVTRLRYGVCGGEIEISETITICGDGTNVFGHLNPGYQMATQNVKLRPIDLVMNELGEKTIEVLKLNCEGSEYGILGRIVEAGIARSVKNIVVQFHGIPTGATLLKEECRVSLRKTHRETQLEESEWYLYSAIRL